MGTSWTGRSKPTTSFTERSKPTTTWNTEGSFELLQENGNRILQESGYNILLENNILTISWTDRVKP